MKQRIYILTTAILLCCFQLVAKPIEVKVGGYVFEPYIAEENRRWTGLAIDLIDELNLLQKDYHFKLVPTTSIRRYDDLKSGVFDIIFFEDLKWGWADQAAKYSSVFLTGGEVFVALKESLKQTTRDQRYFLSLKGKRIAGVRGFHYNFNKYRSSHHINRAEYEMVLAQDGEACLSMLVKDRADMAVVSRALVNRFMAENPQYQNRFLLSERADQIYQHRVLIRDQSPIGMADIDRFLAQLKREGIWQKLLKKNYL